MLRVGNSDLGTMTGRINRRETKPRRNNTSGVLGVSIENRINHVQINGKVYEYHLHRAIATMMMPDGRRLTKRYSIRKYGKAKALALASRITARPRTCCLPNWARAR